MKRKILKESKASEIYSIDVQVDKHLISFDENSKVTSDFNESIRKKSLMPLLAEDQFSSMQGAFSDQSNAASGVNSNIRYIEQPTQVAQELTRLANAARSGKLDLSNPKLNAFVMNLIKILTVFFKKDKDLSGVNPGKLRMDTKRLVSDIPFNPIDLSKTIVSAGKVPKLSDVIYETDNILSYRSTKSELVKALRQYAILIQNGELAIKPKYLGPIKELIKSVLDAAADESLYKDSGLRTKAQQFYDKSKKMDGPTAAGAQPGNAREEEPEASVVAAGKLPSLASIMLEAEGDDEKAPDDPDKPSDKDVDDMIGKLQAMGYEISKTSGARDIRVKKPIKTKRKNPINLDTFAAKLADLAKKPEDFLMIREAIVQRGINYVEQNYGADEADDLKDLLEKQYGLSPEPNFEPESSERPIGYGAGASKIG